MLKVLKEGVLMETERGKFEQIYRLNLESILDYIEKKSDGSYRVMNITDVCEYTGRCPRYVKKNYMKKGSKEITAETLARVLAAL